MCEGGINTGQMKLAVTMVGDSLAQSQQWLEQLHHLADHGRRAITSAELAQVTVMLGEAREKLESAIENLSVVADDVTIERL
ncbi:MAG: hypothetical protein Q8S43_00740 [Actinomycetota bacterium]|nr:MAG: hypothetical protein FD171_1127 [Actinomycetota bacterium]MDO8949883.1 hypothetical protein [Actinomycetota bacterium]MDP3629465.1 hypothetical protein [Actinomycetota bacterium]